MAGLQRGSMRDEAKGQASRLACRAEACRARRKDKHGWLAARGTADKRQCARSWHHLAVEQNGTPFSHSNQGFCAEVLGVGAWGARSKREFYVFGAGTGKREGGWFEGCGPF